MMRCLAITGVMLLAASPALAQVFIYDANPRIIHVIPQSPVPQGHVRATAVPPPAATDETDDEIIERIEQRKRQTAKRPFWKSEPAPRPRAELPPPPKNEPKRALLSAPPVPEVGPGSLTPIYPTPRWRNAEPLPQVTADNNE